MLVGIHNRELDDIAAKLHSPKCDPLITQASIERDFRLAKRDYDDLVKQNCIPKKRKAHTSKCQLQTRVCQRRDASWAACRLLTPRGSSAVCLGTMHHADTSGAAFPFALVHPIMILQLKASGRSHKAERSWLLGTFRRIGRAQMRTVSTCCRLLTAGYGTKRTWRDVRFAPRHRNLHLCSTT